MSCSSTHRPWLPATCCWTHLHRPAQPARRRDVHRRQVHVFILDLSQMAEKRYIHVFKSCFSSVPAKAERDGEYLSFIIHSSRLPSGRSRGPRLSQGTPHGWHNVTCFSFPVLPPCWASAGGQRGELGWAWTPGSASWGAWVLWGGLSCTSKTLSKVRLTPLPSSGRVNKWSAPGNQAENSHSCGMTVRVGMCVYCVRECVRICQCVSQRM